MVKTTKKILSLMLVVLICFSCLIMPTQAATFNDINQSGVFIKQQTNYTCTLAAAVMLVRRTAMAAGNNNWSSITESSMRGTAWLEGSGLYYNFTYAGISVGHSTITSNRKSTYINLLKAYPQGVVAWNAGNGGQYHAVLLTDYDVNSDTFYCADPANGTASGRIPLSSSSIVGSGQDGKINNLNHYWYVKSPSITLTSNEPTSIIYPTSGATYKIAAGVGNNMYLDFSFASNNVQIYEDCDGNSEPSWVKSQYFKLTHVGDGWYSIINVGNGLAVDVYDWNSEPGTNISQYSYHGGDNQLFRFYDAGNGYCYIKSKLGTYVDVKNGDNFNNANVWAYSFNGTTAQKWKLIKKDVPIVDTQKPSISNIKVTDIDSTGYTVTCNVSDNIGVTEVTFPTWTVYNNQDDIVWYKGAISGNTASVRIDVKNHNNEYGNYMTHIYVYDEAENSCTGYTDFINVPKPDTQKPSISNVKVTDINSSGFTITCEVSDNVGIKKVLFPVWTTEVLSPTSKPESSQDDIIYHEATLNGKTATCRINISDHNNSYGEYVCDPHIYDTSNNLLISGRLHIFVPKFVANCERLAPLGTYDVSKNNSIEISIWAFNLTGDIVDCYYQIDNGELINIEKGARPDVVRVYPECKQIDCGFGMFLDASDFSEGSHNIKIIAKSNGAVQCLFESNFVVVKPTFTVTFNANGGLCSTSTKSVKCGNSYGTLPTTTRVGYTFDGWYTSATGGTKITASTKVTTTSDQTLYAHWTCNHRSTEVKNVKSATCTSEGYTGDTYCLGCNTKIADGEETPATGRHNYVGTVTKAATCKSTGVKTYTCSVCNDSYTDVIPVDSTNHEGGTEIRNAVEGNCGEAGYTGDTYCLGCNTKIADGKEIPATGDHTYGNWVVDETDTKKMSRTCTVCGDVEESAVYLAGRSLLFKDIIQIRYYFDFSRFGDDVKSTGLLIWSEDEYKATDVHDINTAPYKMTNMTKRGNSDMYYGESAGVPAKNMIDNQYAIAYAELKDGTIEYTETCTFSPVVYCQTILAEGGNFEATMKNLAAALMNYGAAAQLHFKYKTDTLMNEWMSDELKAVAFDEALIQALPEIDDSKFTLTNDENIRKIGSSLTFVGNIMQNMYFDIENDDIANAREVKLLYWTESEYNKLDSLSYANARKSDLVYDETNSNKTGINCYRTVLEGVSAKDLRGAFMFAVYYKDAEGNEFYGPLFADGAHDYVRRVLITNTAATMKNLAKAFFMYHIAAEKHLLK